MLKCTALLALLLAIGGAASAPLPKFELIKGKGTTRAAVSAVDPKLSADPPAPSPPSADLSQRVSDIAETVADLRKRVADLEDADPPEPGPAPSPTPPPSPGPSPASQLQLSIDSQYSAEVGDMVAITATTNAAKVHWKVIDKGLKTFPHTVSLSDPKTTVVWSMTPGQYRLMAYASVNDDAGDVETVIVVTGQGPQPPPAPIPVPPAPTPTPPVPTPAPTPAAAVHLQNLGIWVIDDSAHRTPATTAIMMDDAFWNSIRQQGPEIAIKNVTNAAVVSNPIVQQAIAMNKSPQYPSGVPTILLFDMSRTKANCINLNKTDLQIPMDTNSIKALVNKYVGGQLR